MGAVNLLKDIKAKRDERVKDLHLDLPVPTWGGDLIARYNVLDRKIVEKISESNNRSVEQDLDFIIQATRELYLKDDAHALGDEVQRMEENSDYVLLTDEGTGVPVKWDLMFVEKLGLGGELKRAREILLYAVGGNAIAVGGLAGRLITWMQDTDQKVVGALSGE